MKKPKHYKPEPGDEFIALKNINASHRGRIFEARDRNTGEGIVGELADANHYLIDGTVAIRFAGERLGIFEVPEAQILLKHEGYVLPGTAPEPTDSGRDDVDGATD